MPTAVWIGMLVLAAVTSFVGGVAFGSGFWQTMKRIKGGS